MDNKETNFQIRTYRFSELALLYFPSLTKESAANSFRRWLDDSEELTVKLTEAGHRKRNKLLTPRQVKIMIEYFGIPLINIKI